MSNVSAITKGTATYAKPVIGKFKVGTKVWSPNFGDGEVRGFDPDNVFKVKARFPGFGTLAFLECGRQHTNSPEPTLFLARPEVWPDPPAPPAPVPRPDLKVDDRVIVATENGLQHRHFAKWPTVGPGIWVYENGGTSWSQVTIQFFENWTR